jgi:hypothetical protein
MNRKWHIITETIDWRGIALSVSYEPKWFSTERAHPVAHLQIETIAPERVPGWLRPIFYAKRT